MKEIIEFYYNFKIEKYIDKQNKIIINDEYVFKEYLGDINELIYIIDLLNLNYINHYEVVYNKEMNILTKYKDTNYILLKIIDCNIDDISVFTNDYKKNNSKLWSEKIDYYMIQMNNFGLGKTNIINSFNYYVGLAETGISLYNNALYLPNDLRYSINHYRMNDDYLDPTNMVIDVLGRDIAELIKYNFYYKDIKLNLVFEIIDKTHMNNKEFNIFYSRLFYPTLYFDEYEKIIVDKNIDKIDSIFIDKIGEYEKLLDDIRNKYKDTYSIPEILWIKK